MHYLVKVSSSIITFSFVMVYTVDGGVPTEDPTALGNSSGIGVAHSQHDFHDVDAGYFDGKPYYMSSTTFQYVRARFNVVQIGADSLPPGIFSTPDQFFDVRITGCGVDDFTAFTLHLVISNTTDDSSTSDGRQVKLLHPAYLFDRIEIKPTGGATEDTIYADQIYHDMCMLHGTDQKATMGNTMGINTGGPDATERGVWSNRDQYDEDGYEIYSGETKHLFIPIHSMLTQQPMFLGIANRQDPRYRFFFRESPTTTDSTAGGVISCQGADGLVEGLLYVSSIQDQLTEKYKSAGFIRRVVVHERQYISLGAITPNQTISDQALNALTGSYADILTYCIRDDATKERLYDSHRGQPDITITPTAPSAAASLYNGAWLPVAVFSLTNSSGNPVFFNNIYGEYLRQIIGSKSYANTFFFGVKFSYPFPFSVDPGETLRTGAALGGMEITTNFKLKVQVAPFNPTPYYGASATTSYTLAVLARRYALLKCSEKGVYEVNKY